MAKNFIIISDFHDTLVDAKQAWLDTFEDLFGKEHDAYKTFVEECYVKGKNKRKFVYNFYPELNDDEKDKKYEEIRKEYAKNLKDKLLKDNIDMLNNFSDSGVPIIVLSGTMQDKLENELRESGLLQKLKIAECIGRSLSKPKNDNKSKTKENVEKILSDYNADYAIILDNIDNGYEDLPDNAKLINITGFSANQIEKTIKENV